MGQYHKLVNLDKKEYIDHYKLGAGAKLLEQIHQKSLIGNALMILLACSNDRGGGDIWITELDYDHYKKTEESRYNQVPGRENWKEVIGRWAGDRIALVGDYAEKADLPNYEGDASNIYAGCASEKEFDDDPEEFQKMGFLTKADLFKDISQLVKPIVMYCCGVKSIHPPSYAMDQVDPWASWLDVEFEEEVA